MRRQCLKQTDCLNGQIQLYFVVFSYRYSASQIVQTIGKKKGNQDERQSYVDLSG
jgi:hypothetical protein